MAVTVMLPERVDVRPSGVVVTRSAERLVIDVGPSAWGERWGPLLLGVVFLVGGLWLSSSEVGPQRIMTLAVTTLGVAATLWGAITSIGRRFRLTVTDREVALETAGLFNRQTASCRPDEFRIGIDKTPKQPAALEMTFATRYHTALRGRDEDMLAEIITLVDQWQEASARQAGRDRSR